MPRILVVGGHTRNIGKTQLVVEIIRAFPQARWTAAKITQYGHGVCSVNGKACGCAVDEHTFAVEEETDRSGQTDTSRFLAAGAARSLWVRTKQGRLAEAMPRLREEMASAENVILESNTVLNFLRPELYLPVLDFSHPDFKASARTLLDRADAYVVVESVPATNPNASPEEVLGTRSEPSPAWVGVPLKSLAQRPVFTVCPERMCPTTLADFIRRRFFAETVITK